MFAKRYNMLPVLDWSRNSPYFEKEGFLGTNNPFEYYFEPISDIGLSEAMKSKNVVLYSKNSRGYHTMPYDCNLANEKIVDLTREYFRIKKNILDSMEAEIKVLFHSKRVLGVQIRGVDWGKVKNHPIPVSLDRYLEEIKTAIITYNFNVVFLATDSDETVQYISNNCPVEVVYFSDTKRTQIGSHRLSIFDESETRDNNKYWLGYEVLRDMHALSKCEGLIAGFSNISQASEVFKMVRGEKYLYKYIIIPEINKSGISAIKAAKKQKRKK